MKRQMKFFLKLNILLPYNTVFLLAAVFVFRVFSFSPCITRRQKIYFLPRLSNQENSVLQGNKVSYSIESWKWGIFRQRQLFCNRKISSVLGCPAFSTGFPHSTVCSPSGRGGHFCPSTSLPAYFRAKMPTPALMAAYCFMRKTSSSCRATNYIQFFSLLQSFFSVYIHHISVILLNKRTLRTDPPGSCEKVIHKKSVGKAGNSKKFYFPPSPLIFYVYFLARS